MDNIKNRVINEIKTICIIEDNIKEQDSLRELGLDSIKMVEVIVRIEDEFGIQFNDSELNPQYFNTVNDLVLLVERYV